MMKALARLVGQHKRKRSNSGKSNLKLKCFTRQELLWARNIPDCNQVKRDQHSVRGLRRATRVDFLHDGSFFQAIGPVLVMAQCFCLMPVSGIRAKSPAALRFKWCSLRTGYSLLYLAITVCNMVLTTNMVIRGHLGPRNMEPLLFQMFIGLAAVLFLRLAIKWPAVMRRWAYVERQMPPFENWQQRECLARRIKLVGLVFFALSTMEHLLSNISTIHFVNYCPKRKDRLESYFHIVSPQLFLVFDYSVWLGMIARIHNGLLTFGWSYMDMFLVIIGIGLANMFKRLQRSMQREAGQYLPASYWTMRRLQYRLICDLIEEVDGAINSLIMLSFANNLYFVCMQCLMSLNKMPSVAHAVYFYFSLGFLLARTLAVSLQLASVHDRSSEPLKIFRDVPKAAYSEEVERFATEVATEVVALTGLRFFNITRKLVLTVAGTIVTYELVLIQFHEDQNLLDCDKN